jgi:hypothetical protein
MVRAHLDKARQRAIDAALGYCYSGTPHDANLATVASHEATLIGDLIQHIFTYREPEEAADGEAQDG